MACQGVDDALGVVLTCTDDVTLVLLQLETEIRSCSFYTCVGIAKALLHLVNDVLLTKLVVVPHLDDVLLSLAAAILKSNCHLQVTLRNGVDYSLCRESYLTTKLLDASLDATDRVLQGVKVTVQIACQHLKVVAVTLDGTHQQVAVLIVGHLVTQALDLALNLCTLHICAIVTVVPVVAIHPLHHTHHHHVGKWIVPHVGIVTVSHHSRHCQRIVAVTICHRSKQTTHHCIVATRGSLNYFFCHNS